MCSCCSVASCGVAMLVRLRVMVLLVVVGEVFVVLAGFATAEVGLVLAGFTTAKVGMVLAVLTTAKVGVGGGRW